MPLKTIEDRTYLLTYSHVHRLRTSQPQPATRQPAPHGAGFESIKTGFKTWQPARSMQASHRSQKASQPGHLPAGCMHASQPAAQSALYRLHIIYSISSMHVDSDLIKILH